MTSEEYSFALAYVLANVRTDKKLTEQDREKLKSFLRWLRLPEEYFTKEFAQ